jgi:hypothetical protein
MVPELDGMRSRYYFLPFKYPTLRQQIRNAAKDNAETRSQLVAKIFERMAVISRLVPGAMPREVGKDNFRRGSLYPQT